MKKTQIKFLTMAMVGLLLLGTYSCKDEYTEEDALKAQQEIDLTIYVVDNTSSGRNPIANAKVTVSQAGTSTEVTTNDKGVAQFPKIKVGGYTYSVTAENYTSTSGTYEADPGNYRQGQVTQQIILYALAGENTATIRGTVIMEKDLTNGTPEPVASYKVYADVSLSNLGTKTFTATTDAQGNYQMVVPTNGANGSSVSLRFPDFEADQVIAFNKYYDATNADNFFTEPQVLPQKETIKTIFSVNTGGGINRYFRTSGGSTVTSITNQIRSVYAVAEAPPTGGTRAIIDEVYTNALGEVTGIDFNTGGNYTGDADGKVTVTITSLDGGSGASISIPLTGVTTTGNASTAYNDNSPTIVPGSGYPKNSNNFTLNKVNLKDPSGTTSLYIYAGQFYYANMDFGTGVSRVKELQR
jgi:hypothetical protein